jgi:hypothetical protein
MITNNVLNYNTQSDNFVMDDKNNEFYYAGKPAGYKDTSESFRKYAEDLYIRSANYDSDSHSFDFDKLHYSEQLELLGRYINYADYDLDSINEFMQQRLHLLLNHRLTPERMINFMKAFISFIHKDLSHEVDECMNNIGYMHVYLDDIQKHHYDLANDY